jgi:hypothetical protein
MRSSSTAAKTSRAQPIVLWRADPMVSDALARALLLDVAVAQSGVVPRA